MLSRWRELLGALIILVLRIRFAPLTPWEFDEFLFSSAVKDFNPAAYHPHPPGYPLFVLIGKLFHEFVGDPWHALVIVNIVAAPFGFYALARLFRRVTGDADLAVCGAFVFYLSASLIVNGPLAMSDGISLMFLIASFLAMNWLERVEHDGAAIALGLFSSAAIGCRPQLVVPLIPALIVALFRMRSMRQRIASVATFTVVSLLWFLPLVDAAGGFAPLVAYERRQASYFAVHDAAMSRGAKSLGEVVIRFLLHPWGSKYITLPLIVISLLGIRAVWRQRRELMPLIVFTIVQVVFEIGWMDPADAARYNLPAMIFAALIVTMGFGVIRASTQFRFAPHLCAMFFVAMAIGYTRRIIIDRTTLPSPPAAAAAYAKAHFPRETVILPDPSLRPAAEYLLGNFESLPIESGLRLHVDQPSTPLVLFVDGGSHAGDTKVFSWHESDAYGKLTRNHYLNVTLDPVDPEERYMPLAGIYGLERTIGGEEWRWLSPEASIRMPLRHSASVELRFRLSPDSPYDANVVHVFVNGRAAGDVNVRKGETAPILVPLPPGANCVVSMRSERAFVPAAVLHNQDPRTLAVQLTFVRQR